MKEHETNQGEGDKASARKYNNDLRDFISSGKVERAADDAREYVESDPAGAAAAEAKAKRGTVRPIDEIVAMGRTFVERVKRGVAAFRENPSVDKSGERPARSTAAGGAEMIDKSGERPARSTKNHK